MRRWSALLLLVAVVVVIFFIFSSRGINNNADRVGQIEDLHNNEEEVTLYYANNEYIRSGNEDMEIVIPIKKNIRYDNMSIEEAAVRALINEPEDARVATAFHKDMEILSVKVENDIAFVDFANENLSGSTFTELLVINQLVKTLVEFPEISKVKILVDGRETETLMGHVDTSGFLQ